MRLRDGSNVEDRSEISHAALGNHFALFTGQWQHVARTTSVREDTSPASAEGTGGEFREASQPG
jgi:hypothetical protein